MTQEQIQNIFKQRYNQNNWKQFLSEAFANARLLQTPEIIVGIDANVASKAQKLGYILLNENGIERQIAVYEVTLAQGIILERNRVGLRNLLRKYWKDIDAAFIVYHKPEDANWRFTYVSELTGYNTDGEFVKIKTEPKRYTYVLGEGESTRTASERFTTIATKGSKATLDDVKDAFSVEKLSKAFFDEYKEHYDIFCDFMVSKPNIRQTIFNGNEKGIRDFNKKLLGRIVFLYFIQKKGWLGVPSKSDWGKGDFNFLTNLFKNAKNPDLFYSDLLSKLFFDTLNSKRKDDLIELIKGESCRIPYLNGGLFEEDDKKHRNLIFPANLFKNLFDFFNQYNFTIYEDDPNDHTVAVDPEMLGHIFENLLEDNKDKGAFYTPKEIVHYMCQESLIEYLTTWFENKGYEIIGYIGFDKPDQPKLFSANEGRKGQLVMETDSKSKQIDRLLIEKLLKKKLDDDDKKLIKKHSSEFHSALDNVKICDPAIGSGAFPMGLLHEIFTAKQTLHTFEFGNTKTFDASAVKLNIIQNSIYGVDIEKGAVDIARLRFWLSLIVDEEKPKALPNLDYKIVVGNSLVSKLGDDIIDIDWTLNETSHGLFGADLAKQKSDLLKKISKEQKEFFNPDSDKKKLADDIRKLKIDILITQLELMVNTKGIEKQPIGTGATIAKQTEIYLQTIGWKNSIKDLQKLKSKSEVRLHFFDWKLDFPEVMNEQIAEKAGFDIVIGNPPYYLEENIILKEYYKSKFKTLHFKINLFACFIEQGFNLLNKGGIFTYIIPNLLFANDSLKLARKYFLENSSPLFFMNLGDNIFESATVPTMIFMTKYTTDSFNQIKIFSKANNVENLSEDFFVNSKESILSNYNYVIETSNPIISKILRKIECVSDILENHLDINQGIITGNDKKYLSDKKESKIWKQTIRGKDITKYASKLPELYVKYSREELACPRTIDLFETEKKLLMRRTGDAPIAALDESQSYNLHTLYSIRSKTKNPIEFYLGLLNSNLFKFIYQQKLGTEIGRTFAEIKILYVRQLPVLKNISGSKKITNTVNKIISLKSQDKETRALEQEIDNIIYKLYELAYNEVRIIDPEFTLTKKEYEAIEV
jgi:adenine-specific DNA-methyltransferase